VKCPECGFVSYSGLTECKKCGHPFVPGAQKKSASPIFSFLSNSSDSAPQAAAPASSPSIAPAIEKQAGSGLEPLAGPQEAPAETDAGSEHEPAEAPGHWQEEISGRVEDFRRRRAQMRGGFDPHTSLDLEFGTPDDNNDVGTSVGARVVELSGRGDPELPPLDAAVTPPDLLTLEKPPEPQVLDSVAVAAGDIEIQSEEAKPVEIFLDSPSTPEAAPTDLHPVLPLAPVGRRFVAGLTDLGILLAGGGLFSLIFWFAGGRISFLPLNFAVLAFVSIFFVTVYFGAFTALAGATPGLLLFGLEVRNWEGQFPTTRESLWRASGYLVSAAALMLGFVWALVDSESLSWHDHMSSTFITTRKAD
jgi:uncharacterized RDD family membrane protein YckC